MLLEPVEHRIEPITTIYDGDLGATIICGFSPLSGIYDDSNRLRCDDALYQPVAVIIRSDGGFYTVQTKVDYGRIKPLRPEQLLCLSD